jgi:hypothetical protein
VSFKKAIFVLVLCGLIPQEAMSLTIPIERLTGAILMGFGIVNMTLMQNKDTDQGENNTSSPKTTLKNEESSASIINAPRKTPSWAWKNKLNILITLCGVYLLIPNQSPRKPYIYPYHSDTLADLKRQARRITSSARSVESLPADAMKAILDNRV